MEIFYVEIINAAKKNPNGWVYKIEGKFESQDNIPPTAIVGAWKVNDEDVIIGEFINNPNYVPATSPEF